jgi:hypothetical protein
MARKASGMKAASKGAKKPFGGRKAGVEISGKGKRGTLPKAGRPSFKKG